jgi:hypothetical protein
MEAYRAIRRATEPVAFPDVLDPAKVEPLSLVPSDVLRTYARQKGKSLIALVPDYLVWWLKGALKGHDALQMYEEDIRRWHDMQEQGDVLLLKPRWSSYWWGHRVDRLALSRWLRQLHQRGYPKLEDSLAMFQMYEHAGFEDTMFYVYGQVLILPDGDLNNNQRFLNRLSAKQLDYLRAGGQLTLRELSPVQREMLLHDVYFGSSAIEKVYSLSELLAAFRSEAERERLAAAEQKSLEISLPHVLYPDGLPADLTIQINRTHPNMFDPYALSPDTIGSLSIEEVGVFAARRAGMWWDFCRVRGLASEISSAENLPSELDEEYAHYIQERVNHYKTNPLLPVRRTPFRLEVRLGGRYAVYFPSGDDWPLYDYEPLNEGKPATLDKLPDALKAEMEKWLKRLKESGSDGSEDGN